MIAPMPTHPMEVTGHLTPAEILDRYRSCKQVLERERWHILHLMTREGDAVGTAEAAKAVGRTRDCVCRIVRRYNKGGPTALKDQRKGKSGKKLLLNDAQRTALFTAIKTHPEDGGLWTAPKVASWVEAQIGKHVSNVTAWQYLRRLGFTLQVPRPKHSETATTAERAVWKKNAGHFALRSQDSPSRQER
jgi:transposase